MRCPRACGSHCALVAVGACLCVLVPSQAHTQLQAHIDLGNPTQDQSFSLLFLLGFILIAVAMVAYSSPVC